MVSYFPSSFLLCSVFCFTVVQNQCIVKKFEEVTTTIQNCSDIVLDNLLIPAGQQLLLNLQNGTKLTFRGNTSFEYWEWNGPLIHIIGNDVTIRGDPLSVIDGQGSLYWDGQGTWGNTTKPRMLKISLRNSTMEDIYILNTPVGCTTIEDSETLTIRNWFIDNSAGDEGIAPRNKFGHNTDGFNVLGQTNNLIIEHSTIFNQDDCVAVSSGSNITIRHLFCHGSHGLTTSQGGDTLENVLFSDSVVVNSENGIHVKTHIDAPDGLIKNVTYQNITLIGCKYYGVNIQQNYKNLPAGQPQDSPPKNNIPIHNLNLIDVVGNVENGAVPVFILCAEEGCFEWKWSNVNIKGDTSLNNCTNYVPGGFTCQTVL